MIEPLLANAALLLAVVVALWLLSVRIGDVSFIDAFWGAGMVLLAVASAAQAHVLGQSGWLLLAMVAAWGSRLAIYLLRRWLRHGEDPRYAAILATAREEGRFASTALVKIWLLQALLLFLVSSPAQAGILAAGAEALGPVAIAGLALYLVGIAFEWLGDWQLAQFKADAANAGKVMTSGVWSATRHPNYFGDAAAWWGIWLVAAAASWQVGLATLAGPVFLTFTLVKWSGAAMTERAMHARYGEAYARYAARTPAFIPFLR